MAFVGAEVEFYGDCLMVVNPKTGNGVKIAIPHFVEGEVNPVPDSLERVFGQGIYYGFNEDGGEG